MTKENKFKIGLCLQEIALSLDKATFERNRDRLKQIEDILIAEEEQEQKTGRWIDGHCSKCGCDVPAYIIDWKWQKDMNAKYCPNCGVDMRESEV